MYKIFRQRIIAVACVIAVALMIHPHLAFGQDGDEEDAELLDWEQRELRTLVLTVQSALTGDLVQAEDPFSFTPHFLKGAEGSTYAPFTLAIDAAKVQQSRMLMYLLVTPRTSAGMNADASDDDSDQADPNVLDLSLFENAAFEDAFFIDVPPSGAAGGPIEIQRAFNAPGGAVYDVYVAIRDSLGEDAEEDDLASSMIMMVKSEVEVPDYWNGELQTSSVILAQAVEPLAQPLTPEEQVASPYSLGGTRIVPKSGESFGKDEELALIMLVYNPQLSDGQTPDLSVGYDFHQKNDAGEEFFNRTNPQAFNAQTLPPGFDMAAGHQVVAGQSIPLGSFPSASYRLEITVTDNASGTTIVRNVNFTVAE